MMKPSAFTRVTKRPLTDTDNSIMRDSAPLVKTTSLSTMRCGSDLPLRVASIDGRFERWIQLVDPDLGKEPEAAEVDAEDRDVASRLCDAISDREQGAV